MDMPSAGRTIQSQAAGIGGPSPLGTRDVLLCGDLRPIFQDDSSFGIAIEP